MNRLYLLYKVERGLRQADRGELISPEEVRQRMAKWLKLKWTPQAADDLEGWRRHALLSMPAIKAARRSQTSQKTMSAPPAFFAFNEINKLRRINQAENSDSPRRHQIFPSDFLS